MPRKKKEKDTTDMAAKVEAMTEQESLVALDEVKDRICVRVRNINNEEDAQAEKKALMREFIAAMRDELDDDVLLKTELENHLRRLSALGNP